MHHARDIVRSSLPDLRVPVTKDGAAIWELVRECKPLDENSMYCNLVQCDHFADTCVVAELNGDVVGWISGYITPSDPETLFVWQVAVSEKARGMGLGAMMLRHLVERPACADVTRLQTTITSDNDASWALFRKFAHQQGGGLDAKPYYTQALHFQGQQSTENLVTIKLAKVLARAA